MAKKLALLTIGESPRIDLEPDIKMLSDRGIEIVQVGALDGLAAQDIAACFPDKTDYVLVSRMRNGSQIKLSRKKIVPLLQKKIDDLDHAGITMIIPLCSCAFPELNNRHSFLIQPSKILFSTVMALAQEKRLAVIMPTQEQIPLAKEKWRAVSNSVCVLSASPYISPQESLRDAASAARIHGADMCILDCAGFSSWMKELVARETNLPTISALGITLSVACGL